MVQHADIDHTGITGTGGASAGVGNQVFAAPMGFEFSATSTASSASLAFVAPIVITAAMKLRGAKIRVTSGAAGSTNQWGLFDYSSSVTACTKLAGGSGALGSTGWQTIAASGAPVDISPGRYMLIYMNATATNPTVAVSSSVQSAGFHQSQAAYTWDDTPTLMSGWAASTGTVSMYLYGDLDGSGNQWA